MPPTAVLLLLLRELRVLLVHIAAANCELCETRTLLRMLLLAANAAAANAADLFLLLRTLVLLLAAAAAAPEHGCCELRTPNALTATALTREPCSRAPGEAQYYSDDFESDEEAMAQFEASGLLRVNT